jgi:hypothetical protein
MLREAAPTEGRPGFSGVPTTSPVIAEQLAREDPELASDRMQAAD